jgi:O-antigen ligase
MNTRWPDTGTTPGTALLLVVVLAGAAVAGMMTAFVGSMAGARAIYYAAVFGLIVVGGMVAVTRREPVRFVFLALIAGLPLVSMEVPPGRLEITVFDAVMVSLMIALVWGRMAGTQTARGPIFPTGSLAIAWLLAVPCVAFSQFPVVSLKMFVLTFALYAFFLLVLEELKRERGFERLAGLLSIVLIVMAVGCFIERVFQVNLSLRGANLNQLSYSDAGVEIYRAGGFFQDPQKAAAYMAAMIAFLLVLSIRGRFRGTMLAPLAWVSILFGLAALMTTVSRAAILACLCLSALALFAFNKWSAAAKLLVGAGAGAAVLAMTLTPVETWMSVFPAAVADRFRHAQEEFLYRTTIWFDTWNMFADHPLTGIGFGSFRDYLKMTQPTVFNFYGLGDATGVGYIPDNPESGYFKVLYEGGIIGALAVLVVTCDAVRRALGVIAGRNASSHARTEVLAAAAALLVFAVTFVTLFTIADQRVGALVAFLVALIWHHSLSPARQAPRNEPHRWNRR